VAFVTFPAVVRLSERVTPSVLHLGFERSDGRALEFKPGQFINLHFEAETGPTHRSYSVANPPGSTVFEIAMSPVEGGQATRMAFALKPGDVVQVSGPYGRFVLKEDPACRYILVGTGTGITPYRAMLPQLAQRIETGQARVELLVGVRSREEFLFAEDFKRAAREIPGLSLHARYSRQMPENPEAWETRGYVQDLFPDLGMSAEQDIVYLCGNPNMVDAASDWLKQRGFPIKRIRREKYVSANA
jgi:ferredoxin-NADP reductase